MFPYTPPICAAYTCLGRPRAQEREPGRSRCIVLGSGIGTDAVHRPSPAQITWHRGDRLLAVFKNTILSGLGCHLIWAGLRSPPYQEFQKCNFIWAARCHLIWAGQIQIRAGISKMPFICLIQNAILISSKWIPGCHLCLPLL